MVTVWDQDALKSGERGNDDVDEKEATQEIGWTTMESIRGSPFRCERRRMVS